jgi:hypothetical protein
MAARIDGKLVVPRVGKFEASTLGWCQPWLRVSLLMRVITDCEWDAHTRPTAKGMLAKALEIRGAIRQAGWFN